MRKRLTRLTRSEAVKNYVHRGLEPDVYVWRDSGAHEIDLAIERGKDLVPVEAKSGETCASDFLDGIRYSIPWLPSTNRITAVRRQIGLFRTTVLLT